MKKLLAILLALTLALTLVPTLAFAQNEDGAEPGIVEESKETPTEAPEGETTEEPKEESQENPEGETKEEPKEEPEGEIEDTGDVQAAPLLTAENTGLTGDGTAENPYEIGTADDLKTFRDLINNGASTLCAKLTADIDLKNEAWTPIGTKDKPYSGKLNGSGKAISGLNVTGGEYAGLFGCTDGAAIWDMAVSGAVAGTKYAGGIVGHATDGSIEGCVSLCRVSPDGSGGGDVYAGGIVGYLTTTDSTSIAVKNCANLRKISAEASGSCYVGGIVGQIAQGQVYNCYNVGNVVGNVTGSGKAIVGSIAGSIGSQTLIQYSCWLTGTAGNDIGARGGTTAIVELSKAQFANEEALTELRKGGGRGAWTQTGYVAAVDMYLPLLDWQTPDTPDITGTGTEGDPYWIYTAEGLKDFRDKVNNGEATNAYAELKDNIDLNSESWTPIGTEEKPYTGSFNGNGHTISGLYVKDKVVSAGLFGYTKYEDGKQIQNVAVTGYVEGTTYAGGIVGYAGLDITRCVNLCRVVVSGSDTTYAGGIAGLTDKGTIYDCTNIGPISGKDSVYAGGIAGYASSGMVSRCCNVGEVSVSSGNLSYVGGIAGHTTMVSKCYWLTGTAERAVGESDDTPDGTSVMTKADFADGTVLALLKGKDPTSVWTETGYVAAVDMILPLLSWQEADTFQINTVDELKEFRKMVNGGAAGLCGKLTADIDLKNESWTPIGTKDKPYSGTFDGNGKTISGLNVTGGDYAGLFGYTDGATIQNMAVSGTVAGTKYAGGIAGYAKGGSIEGCVNQCLVSASGSEAYAGGIVGYLTDGSAVRNCANLKAISADGSKAYAGGIAGYMVEMNDRRPEISGCYNVGSITGAAATGTPWTGSIAGYAYNGDITNCRWLVGTAEKIASGWPRLNIDYYSSDIAKSKAHFADGTVQQLLRYRATGDSPWTKTGYLAAAGMTVPLLSWQTADSSHEHDAKGVLGGCTCGLLPDGKGTAKTPYEITTADDLKAFRDLVNGDLRIELRSLEKPRCARLMNDIVLNDGTFNEDGTYTLGASGKDAETWEPIKYYTGTFDGDGYTIKGLYVNSDGKSGLFGEISNATIQNVTVTGYVSSKGSAGGIVGDVVGGSVTIENCVNHCTVRSTNNDAGGIVGCLSYGTLEISDCANYGTVISSNSEAGGIVGYGSGHNNELRFQRCLNTGRVKGGSSSGGIAGRIWINSSLTDCFNTGAVTGTNSNTDTGGIVGGFSSYVATMTSCYSVGAVTAPESAASGGLIGSLPDNKALTATHCYWLEGTAETAIGNPAETPASTSAKTKTQFADGTVRKLLVNDRTDSPWADECQYFVAAGMILPVFKGYSHTHSGGTADCCHKAKCEVCGAEYGALDPDSHTNLKHVEAKRATTRAEGNIEYWYCDGCGKYYKDEAATKEITQADTVIAKKRRTNSDSTDSTGSTADKTVKSSNTGDPGVMLYVGLAAMSLTGGAWLRRKKH